jgi:O-methyltransferase involved in polyketide biosynthesis
MSNKPTDKQADKHKLSPHRHISFTAHYTGYIWYLLNISHPALASKKGKQLVTLLHPFESLAERFVGGSMRSTLKQRHQLINRQLDQLIEQYPNLQVIEVATGLSPRGWRYRQKYPHITYIEADLPEMAQTKRDALANLGETQADIVAIDLFSPEFKYSFPQLDSSRPLVIISEGLVNYFNKDSLQLLWGSFAQLLKCSPQGFYLTDLYPEPIKHKLAKLIWQSSKLLKVLSKSSFSFHFQSPAEVISFMQQTGFKSTLVYQPKDSNNPAETEHRGDLVWVIQSQV